MQSNSFSSRGLCRADADFDDRHQSLERASNFNQRYDCLRIQ